MLILLREACFFLFIRYTFDLILGDSRQTAAGNYNRTDLQTELCEEKKTNHYSNNTYSIPIKIERDGGIEGKKQQTSYGDITTEKKTYYTHILNSHTLGQNGLKWISGVSYCDKKKKYNFYEQMKREIILL